MGGPNKLLMDYRSKPLLQHALDLVASLDLAQRIFVTGRDAEAVSRIVPEGFEIVFNSRFTDGMGGSIATGARALGTEIDGVLIFLGDMPNIQLSDVDKVMRAFNPSADGSIVVPQRGGQQGHPVLFARFHFAALGDLSGDCGARTILMTHARTTIRIESSAGILRDLDSAEDFAAG